MSVAKDVLILRWLSALTLAAGVFLFWNTVTHHKNDHRHLARKTSDLEALYEVERSLAGERTALRTFEALPNATVQPLDEILQSSLPNTKPTLRSGDQRPLVQGWAARQMELSFATIALQDLGNFLKKAEAIRPPWRLQECTIVASDDAPGSGRVTLVMEVLEKSR
jgi:hypothetical protein